MTLIRRYFHNKCFLPLFLLLALLSYTVKAEDAQSKLKAHKSLPPPKISSATRTGLEAILSDPNEFLDDRLRAAQVLGIAREGSAWTIVALKTALESEHASLRANAAWALGRSGKAEVQPLLIPLLLDSSSTVRKSACLALREVPDLTSAALQNKIPLQDSDPQVVLAALYLAVSLPAEMNTHGSLDMKILSLYNTYAEADNVTLQQGILRYIRTRLLQTRGALTSLDTATVVIEAADAADTDTSNSLDLITSEADTQANTSNTTASGFSSRYQSYKSEPAGEVTLWERAATPILVAALHSDNLTLIIASLEALGRLNSYQGLTAAHLWTDIATNVNTQVQTLMQHESNLVRRAAIYAYVGLNPGSAALSLGKFSQDSDASVRRAVAQSLALTPLDKKNLVILESMLADSSRDVRRQAAQSLATLSGVNTQLSAPPIVAIGERALNSSSSNVRREGFFLFGTLGAYSDRILPALRRAEQVDSQSKDSRELALALWVFTQVRIPDTISEQVARLAIPYINHREAAVRTHACKLLGLLEYKPAAEPLSKAVTDIKFEMGMPYFTYTGLERTNALWALGKIANDSAIDALITLSATVDPIEEVEQIKSIIDTIIAADKADEAVTYWESLCKNQNIGAELINIYADAIAASGRPRPDVEPYTPSPLYGNYFYENNL